MSKIQSNIKKDITIISFGHLNPKGIGGGIISWFLSKKLKDHRHLDKLIILSKGANTPDFPCVESIPFFNYYSYVAANIVQRLKIPPYILRGINEKLFDYFTVRLINDEINTIIVTHPVIPCTLKRAKRMGIKTVLIAPNPFDPFIKELIKEEKRLYRINSGDPYTSEVRISGMKKSFINIDYIISATSAIKDTYTKGGLGGKIVDLNYPAGPNFDLFKSNVEKSDNVFRVCYIAHTVLLKGLQYLLEAWKRLELENAELVVGSGIDDNVKKIIKTQYSELHNVKYAGHINDLNSFYKKSTLFVCPSLIDGGPRTVYEAMVCGLPVVLTEGCGAKDLIQDEKEGFVVPIRDATAIKEKIQWFYDHPEETKQMGLNARKKIEGYSIERFAEMVVKTLEDINSGN